MAEDFDDPTNLADTTSVWPPTAATPPLGRDSVAVGSDPIGVTLAQIEQALASAADMGAWQLDELTLQERLVDALRARASVEELTARLVRSVADREFPRLAGSSSTRAWLASVHGLSTADAARLVAEAAAHPGDPVCDDQAAGRTEPTRRAWTGGALSAERAVLVAATVDRLDAALPRPVTDSVQANLVAASATLTYLEFRTLCAHTVEVVDPDGADALLEAQLAKEEARALAQTRFMFRRVGDGTTRLAGLLPDAQADMFKTALDAYSAPRRRHHDADQPDDPPLGYPERLGRALAELVEHLPADGLPQHGVANAQIVVTVTLEQLRAGAGECHLDTGTTISTGQLRRLACNAAVLPAVLGGDSAILDLGTSRRLFSRHQRLALAVRDQGCVWPGCDRPPTWCEAHHITTWSTGGPTDLANGALLCSYHHHLVHGDDGWQIRIATDGRPEIVPPPRLDPSQTPRRHERFRPERLRRPALC